MSTRIGIVGMPNAGKSSLFNALTKAGAEAANYPFTTIEPNVAVVPIRDARLEQVVADAAPVPKATSTVPPAICSRYLSPSNSYPVTFSRAPVRSSTYSARAPVAHKQPLFA